MLSVASGGESNIHIPNRLERVLQTLPGALPHLDWESYRFERTEPPPGRVRAEEGIIDGIASGYEILSNTYFVTELGRYIPEQPIVVAGESIHPASNFPNSRRIDTLMFYCKDGRLSEKQQALAMVYNGDVGHTRGEFYVGAVAPDGNTFAVQWYRIKKENRTRAAEEEGGGEEIRVGRGINKSERLSVVCESEAPEGFERVVEEVKGNITKTLLQYGQGHIPVKGMKIVRVNAGKEVQGPREYAVRYYYNPRGNGMFSAFNQAEAIMDRRRFGIPVYVLNFGNGVGSFLKVVDSPESERDVANLQRLAFQKGGLPVELQYNPDPSSILGLDIFAQDTADIGPGKRMIQTLFDEKAGREQL